MSICVLQTWEFLSWVKQLADVCNLLNFSSKVIYCTVVLVELLVCSIPVCKRTIKDVK